MKQDEFREIKLLENSFNVFFPEIDYDKYNELLTRYSLETHNAEEVTKKNIVDIIETVRELKDKANVELGHFNAIFATLVKYEGLKGLVNDMAKEETEQHVSEYINVANAAKAEGHDDIEAMLCAFSEQEKGIAETLKRTRNAF